MSGAPRGARLTDCLSVINSASKGTRARATASACRILCGRMTAWTSSLGSGVMRTVATAVATSSAIRTTSKLGRLELITRTQVGNTWGAGDDYIQVVARQAAAGRVGTAEAARREVPPETLTGRPSFRHHERTLPYLKQLVFKFPDIREQRSRIGFRSDVLCHL